VIHPTSIKPGPTGLRQAVDAITRRAYPPRVPFVERKEMTMKVARLISVRLDASAAE